MNNYKVVVGVDEKAHLLLQYCMITRKKLLKLNLTPVKFEKKIKPYLKKFKQSDILK
jgi:hypothetical protein